MPMPGGIAQRLWHDPVRRRKRRVGDGIVNRLDLADGGKAPHFIGAWQLDPQPVCDDIVAFFENNPAKQRRGATAGGENTDIKNSTDIIVHPAQLSEPVSYTHLTLPTKA